MKNILIPLELTNTSIEERIVTTAISYSKELKAKCWLIHVASPDPEFVSPGNGPQYVRDQIAQELRSEHRQIQTIADLFAEHKVEAEGLLIQGATHEMIMEEINKLDIDLLILGNKKHSFIDVFFRGSVTDELMSKVNIPILLIPDNSEN